MPEVGDSNFMLKQSLLIVQSQSQVLKETYGASALPKTYEFIRVNSASIKSQLKLAYKNSKPMQKLAFEDHEPVDLLLWLYAPALRKSINKYFLDKGKRLNKILPARACRMIDNWLLCVLQSHVVCTAMLSQHIKGGRC